MTTDKTRELKACPFCGSEPRRYVENKILHVECPECVSVGFHTHIRFGRLADSQWNTRPETSTPTDKCGQCAALEQIKVHLEMMVTPQMKKHAMTGPEGDHDLPFQVYRYLLGYDEALEELNTPPDYETPEEYTARTG